MFILSFFAAQPGRWRAGAVCFNFSLHFDIFVIYLNESYLKRSIEYDVQVDSFPRHLAPILRREKLFTQFSPDLVLVKYKFG